MELPEPLDELPPEELPGAVLLLGELPAPDELLPLDGAVVDPAPPDGLVAELLPDEEGERGVAVEPLLGGLLEPLLLEPELSQATSEAAERKAAAISHLFSIDRLHMASRAPTCGGTMLDASLRVIETPITERRRQKFRARFSSHPECPAS